MVTSSKRNRGPQVFQSCCTRGRARWRSRGAYCLDLSIHTSLRRLSGVASAAPLAITPQSGSVPHHRFETRTSHNAPRPPPLTGKTTRCGHALHTHTDRQTHTPPRARAHTHPHTHTHTYPHTHTPTHSLTHTLTHPHTHTHTHIRPCCLKHFPFFTLQLGRQGQRRASPGKPTSNCRSLPSAGTSLHGCEPRFLLKRPVTWKRCKRNRIMDV